MARVTDQDFDDDKGIGLVLVNTAKGKAYFDKLDMDVRATTLEKAGLCNGGFNEHTDQHPKRAVFFAMLQQGKSVSASVAVCLRISVWRRIARRMKAIVRRVVAFRRR